MGSVPELSTIRSGQVFLTMEHGERPIPYRRALEAVMFTLDQAVPWGRSFEEYRRMFALSEADLRLKILGCADGPASFNAESTRCDSAVVSVDPLYRLDSRAIRDRIEATCDRILDQAQGNRLQFVWDTIRSVGKLGRIRMQGHAGVIG